MMYVEEFRKMRKLSEEISALNTVINTLFDAKLYRTETYYSAEDECTDRKNDIECIINSIYVSLKLRKCIPADTENKEWVLCLDNDETEIILEEKYPIEFIEAFCEMVNEESDLYAEYDTEKNWFSFD